LNAQVARQLKAGIVYIDHEHSPCTGEHSGLQRQQPDHPRADHKHCVVERNRRKGHRMDGNRHCLNQGRMSERHLRRQVICNPRGHCNVLRKRAHAPERGRRNANHLALVAQVHLSATAEETLPAKHSRVERDPVARTKAGHGTANFFHHTGGFVSHHDRRNPPPGAAVITMDIASANAAGFYPNQQLIRRRARLGEFSDF